MLEAAFVIGGIGIVAAVGLGLAARIFYVYVDPKIVEVREALPSVNCGGCGYAGCAAAAEAIVEGKALPNVCVAGGIETAEALAAIMGLSVQVRELALAELGCKYGKDAAHLLFDYDGVFDCRTAALVAGGGKGCTMGCLGFGTCANACLFDALHMGEDGLPHVIEDKCTGCGICERVCPKGIIRVQSPSRKFTHFQTNDDCVAPCQSTCPAQINIPDYIAAIARGEYENAVRIIKETNPLPLVCGRVCPHPCETTCRRGDGDEPVNINHLKRFAADYEYHSGERIIPSVLPDTGKKVAIIGAGPSGLTSAYYLARLGHQVKIFEAMPKPGGMLLYGIPEYRLPKKVLSWEIQGILSLGVKLECNSRLGRNFSMEDLEKQGFEAIYLAVGAWGSRRLGVPGEQDYKEVASGIELLINRGLGKETPVGKKAIIVGGGNTAMDTARTSWRLGAENVHLLYRRSRKEMPANDAEVEQGEREELQYHFLAAPTELTGDSGKLKALEFQKMELGEPDASGRSRPVPIEGSVEKIEADNIFAAIGQSPDLNCLGEDELGKKIPFTRWNTIEAQDGTMQTDIPKIFTGGDCWRGAATAVQAIRDGRLAARAIHRFLVGEDIKMPGNWHEKPPDLPGIDHGVTVVKTPRAEMPELSVDERRLNFNEVELGLTEEMAKKETERCLQCGLVCYRGYREGVV
ncbi:MAG: FAD-dependent oxidoreductase [Proteobacteria bacterium]|nr:FAD-dependent oxidoreductase [Pseudomonadota bacterium]